jgi:hypothetical protein
MTTCEGGDRPDRARWRRRRSRVRRSAGGLLSVDDEIYYLPEYYYWDLVTPTGVGCPFGGTLVFEPSVAGEQLAFGGCAFSAGFALTGTGEYNYDEERFSLQVSVSGLASGELIYVRKADGSIRDREIWRREIDLSG